VPISVALIERLLAAYPVTIAGAKDSSGDWNVTQSYIDNFAADGFDVFPGSESFLLRGLRAGGVGCISATANVNPAAISRLHAEWEASTADAQQAGLDVIRGIFARYPMIPAMKAAIAHYGGDSSWEIVRPPLVELSADQRAQLMAELDAAGFTMPGMQ
jgi:4-hydroxy-tetrahydrodipicolinate synthase